MEDQEELGILIDELDSLAHALNIPMPDSLHVQSLKTSLPEKVLKFKELFVRIFNNNPWE